jgi:hypothetical protein
MKNAVYSEKTNETRKGTMWSDNELLDVKVGYTHRYHSLPYKVLSNFGMLITTF